MDFEKQISTLDRNPTFFSIDLFAVWNSEKGQRQQGKAIQTTMCIMQF